MVKNSAIVLDLAVPLYHFFPNPQTWKWTRSDGQKVLNSSTTKLGYPSASFFNVSKSDAGYYMLTGTNHVPSDPSRVIGSGSGSFTLNVLCKSHYTILESLNSLTIFSTRFPFCNECLLWLVLSYVPSRHKLAGPVPTVINTCNN